MMACASSRSSGGMAGDELIEIMSRVPSTSRIQYSSYRPGSALYPKKGSPLESIQLCRFPLTQSVYSAVSPEPVTSQVGHRDLQVLPLVAEQRHVGRRLGQLERGELAQRGGEVVDGGPDGGVLGGGVVARLRGQVVHGDDAHPGVPAVVELGRPDPPRPALGGDLEGRP